MTIKLPQNNKWFQKNTTEKFNPNEFGSLVFTKNLSFDEKGYMVSSPRSFTIMDEDIDSAFGVPVAIGKVDTTDFIVSTTSDSVFNFPISTTSLTFSENSGSDNPTMTGDSRSCYFNNTWLASTDTAVLSRALSSDHTVAWTSRITGLTSGKIHHLEVFKSRNTICVSNGNTIVQKDSSYSASTTLTIPADYEIVGMAYNNSTMGVITKPASSVANSNAIFFTWDGSGTSATGGYDIGSDAGVSIVPYKSSYVILTRSGQLLYFNGGGFEQLAQFPFFSTEQQWGLSNSAITYGNSMIVEDDLILINVGFTFQEFGRKKELYNWKNPSGVWAYDPDIGLYHRYSPSISQAWHFIVTDSNVNLTTNVFTISSGTLPATGTLVRYISATTTLGGLSQQNDYYLIKASDTTFKLATTYDNSILGTAIDITSKGSGSNFFYMFDLIDYGTTYYTDAGALGLIGGTSTYFTDLLIGGDFYDTSLNSNDSLCMTIPMTENRSIAILSRIFAESIEDVATRLEVRYKPLDTNEKIIVRIKEKDVIGLPVSSTASNGTWSAKNIIYSTMDYSEAKTYLDNGGSLLMEVIAGVGAGTYVEIESIGYDSGIYSFELKEDVVGVTAGLKSHFVIDNWEQLGIITTDDVDGYKEIPIEKVSKAFLVMIEMRGYQVTIEDIKFINKTYKKSN